jgi:hypothetical protein
MECLNNLLINTILDIVNQIKSQISSSVVHLTSGLAGIRTPGLDRHNTSWAKLNGTSLQLHASLLGVCCNQRALVDESGIIRTQMGTLNR